MNYIEGVFIEECNNRFLAWVLVNGVEELSYVPSSAKLSNFLKMEGKNVLLQQNSKPGRTKYTIVAAKLDERYYIYLHLNNINNLLKAYIEKNNKIDIELEKSLYWGYRADLKVNEPYDIIFEAKGIISDEKAIVFPKVCGDRAYKQLRDFSKALSENFKVIYCLVLMSPTIEKISINKQDAKYLKAMIECLAAGMKIKVFEISKNEHEFVCDYNCEMTKQIEDEVYKIQTDFKRRK